MEELVENKAGLTVLPFISSEQRAPRLRSDLRLT
jgi:hypothetical protein